MQPSPRRRVEPSSRRPSRTSDRAARRAAILAIALLGGSALGVPALARAAEGGTAGTAVDGPLAPPEGEVLLVVTGAIDRPNVGEEAHIDRAHLERLPRERFTTTTPWSDDPAGHEYEGVRLDALLRAVGAWSARFEALALDDYAATFEGVDLERYPVIVADTEDGEPLTVRRLGPLWIMFPFDLHPELLTQTNRALAVWQLVRMDVR